MYMLGRFDEYEYIKRDLSLTWVLSHLSIHTLITYAINGIRIPYTP